MSKKDFILHIIGLVCSVGALVLAYQIDSRLLFVLILFAIGEGIANKYR